MYTLGLVFYQSLGFVKKVEYDFIHRMVLLIMQFNQFACAEQISPLLDPIRTSIFILILLATLCRRIYDLHKLILGSIIPPITSFLCNRFVT